VCEVVVLLQKVDIVRRDESNAELFRQFRQLRIDLILLLDVLLNFNVKPIRPEDIQVSPRQPSPPSCPRECRGHFPAGMPMWQ
jgi:hypothetical protein